MGREHEAQAGVTTTLIEWGKGQESHISLSLEIKRTHELMKQVYVHYSEMGTPIPSFVLFCHGRKLEVWCTDVSVQNKLGSVDIKNGEVRGFKINMEVCERIERWWPDYHDPKNVAQCAD